jgi:Pyruvate/2-oxoacid:ferredoxin oxidoreductase gamma subunit
VNVLALNFTKAADELGDSRAANMVMLGALLEISNVLSQASIEAALRRLVKSAKWYELDERALVRGRELFPGVAQTGVAQRG